MNRIVNAIRSLKQKIFKTSKKSDQQKSDRPIKQHSDRYNRTVAFMNKYSLIFHAILACFIVFIVEFISRRNVGSAVTFLDMHTKAYIYNAFIVFCSFTVVYLFRRRAFARFIISGLWIFLGIVNGCVLSNRVTPFAYTDMKCIPELFAMTENTNYFTAQQAMIVVAGVSAFVCFCVFFFIKGPKYQGSLHVIVAPIAIVALLFVGLPMTTKAAQGSKIIDSYFSNIAQGYENYGFIYGFSCSVVDRGMSKPDNYSEENIKQLMQDVETKTTKTKVKPKKQPNVICVLLESFCDPDEIKFLETNKDPIPTFHKLEKEFSTGYLNVPVVGAGTANTEFEILTGMSMEFFGTGEYPYKTILKSTNCESVASDLSPLGYGTHVVHNNGGNFYSRVNAFSMFGFDSFTSKEMMDIKTYTPNKSWATDDILVPETVKAMDATPKKRDFTYVITVGTHGDYPTEPVIENPPFVASGLETEEETNQWTYYVNQLNEVDTFMKDLIEQMEQRDEDTIIVFYGDHLPTLGLEDRDMVSNDIYKTKYVTWNNFGLEKKDADLYSYQLLANVMDQVGIHEGTIMQYHQTQKETERQVYLDGLENLQYDILYGKRYCYDGEDAYPATDIEMGVQDVDISSVKLGFDGNRVFINGTNFTRWSEVYVNDEPVDTAYINNHMLAIQADLVQDGDTIVVNQMGSSNTIFRSSNSYRYASKKAEE